jgi:hypothetical protein
VSRPAPVYTDPGPIEWEAVLHRSDASGAACFVDVPFDLKGTFGRGNLVPVLAVWDGTVTYRGSLARMGGPCAMLLCRKDVVAQLGKGAGDRVHVRITLDATPREVPLPEDLQATMEAHGEALGRWEDLSASCRREYVQWIEEAKRPDTRVKRIGETVARVAQGKRRTD